MPSYKVDVVKRYGKLHYAIWKAGEARPDLFEKMSYAGVEALLVDLEKEVDERTDPADALVFRQIAYDDRGELFQDIKRAEY